MGILMTEADAAAAAGSAVGSFSIILVWVLMIAALWFFMIRPQNKERKRVAAMLSTLEAGDSVMTTSGFYGTVISVEENGDTIIVEFGNNKNCRIPMDKSAISRVEKPGE